MSKRRLARELGVSRSSLYYHRKIPDKDEQLKGEIQHILHLHPSYGYRRLSLALDVNGKRIRRVMRLFGLKPYRRRGRKPRYAPTNTLPAYPNLIKGTFPTHAGEIWVSDFTYIPFHGSFVYLATILDLYSRGVVGWHVSTSHDAALTSAALFHALSYHPVPKVLHSDQGNEYKARSYVELAERFSIRISMSKKKSPWENGYQEAFFSTFKVDLGDPNRFTTLGELTEYIHLTIHIYNTYRIHTRLKMSPRQYLRQQTLATT